MHLLGMWVQIWKEHEVKYETCWYSSAYIAADNHQRVICGWARIYACALHFLQNCKGCIDISSMTCNVYQRTEEYLHNNTQTKHLITKIHIHNFD